MRAYVLRDKERWEEGRGERPVVQCVDTGSEWEAGQLWQVGGLSAGHHWEVEGQVAYIVRNQAKKTLSSKQTSTPLSHNPLTHITEQLHLIVCTCKH